MRKRSVSFVAVAVAVVALVSPVVAGLTASAAAAATSSSTHPVDARDFPDPSVLWDAGTATYYAYATGNNSNLQVMSSKDLSTWGLSTDPLPVLAPWVRAGLTWAPGVVHIGSRYVMYYTATESNTLDQCLGLATATKPAGPFVDASTAPFLCQRSSGGSIDANPVMVGGRPYLLWKSDDNHAGNNPTRLWSQALAADGLSLIPGAPTLLLTGSLYDWRRPIIEGPTMVANAAGSYDLFYGAGWWTNSSAGIGYATCASPLSACSNRSTYGPWMGSNSSIAKNGPSGPSIFTDVAGKVRIAYHAWGSTVGYSGGQRKLWIDTLSFYRSTPSIP